VTVSATTAAYSSLIGRAGHKAESHLARIHPNVRRSQSARLHPRATPPRRTTTWTP